MSQLQKYRFYGAAGPAAILIFVILRIPFMVLIYNFKLLN